MKQIVLWVVVLLAVLGGWYLYKNSSFSKNQPTLTSQSVTNNPSVSAVTQKNFVTLTQNGFSPATLTIKAGESVTWKNMSGEDATVNSDPHPTHTDYPPLNLGGFSNGASLSLKFPTAGTYGYHNHLNPGERATIIVQ